MGSELAPELLGLGRISARRSSPSNTPPSYRLVNKDLQIRFTAIVLVVLTAGAVTLAWINFQKERDFQVPYDGVWWIEKGGQLVADRVEPNGPGARAGVKQGDQLAAVDKQPVTKFATLVEEQYRDGIYSRATYSLIRQSIPLDAQVVLIPADRSLYTPLRLIGLVYLGIGLYVLLRRWTAPKSTHFYLFCLVSFVFYSFHFTGKLNDFDWSIYWGNVAAWLLQPTLFLHFVLTFPEKKHFVRKHAWVVPGIYVVPLGLLWLHISALNWMVPTERLRRALDRMEMVYLAAFFILATWLLWRSYRRANTPVLRQQLKWVTRGTILAIAPFTLFYVVPFLLGSVPNSVMRVSVLSLVFLPLTFGYAIFRYRLMDVDLIFKRGVVYTLAAAAIVGAYFALVAGVAEVVHLRVPNSGPLGMVIAVAVTAILFDPVRKWIQERVDHFFYRTRYDYRRTLIDFGRDLSSETDLDKMLSSAVDRLSRTLLVDRMAIFLVDDEEHSDFVLSKSFGMSQTSALDLSFLSTPRPEMEEGHLFFDNTHLVPRETPGGQETIAKLDLNYYIPCRAQQRTIAFLGLGKTVEGDFLSSEDVELLQTVAGYVGIAIQNARLYASLEQKIIEYERLKDFNENIVESISVGVLALDLEDRIESWNSQMEVMYALPRFQALRRPIAEVMPANFVEEFYRVRQTPGIHNLYKFRLGTPAGETRIVNVAIAPLVTKKFNVIGRLIIVDDITERVELESQLAQADKLSSIGLLAAGVAHEVNTPLAVISSYAQMLSKQLHGDLRKAELLEKITRSTFRASEIVNNLLNFSRTSGTEFTNVDMNRVISDTLALLEHQFKIGRVSVQKEFTPHLPAINGNAGRLQQVFLNLFLNAKDAMPGGGILRVATSNGTGVSVIVSDTGSGIAQEHISRIYDPFFTTKTHPRHGQSRGTGLGLSVTYGIIQEHAGKIRVESQPGAGTTFFLDFPLTRKAVNV